uniref:Tail protein n=1 Tax=viral metagenome TaxID=1070528 RepID=A0A6M3L190_9ZZZZ
MRTLSGTLAAMQKVGGPPYVSVNLLAHDDAGVDPDITASVLAINHIEQQYGGAATVLVEDSAKALIGNNYRGYRMEIGYGYTTGAGNETSLAPPLWVRSMRPISVPGRTMVEFQCYDLWQRLQVQSVMSSFGPAPAWTDKTIYAIFQQILSGICSVTLDSDDGIINTYKPHYQTAQVNDPIAGIIAELLGMTNSGARVRPYLTTGKMHFLTLTGSGSDVTYQLGSGNYPFYTSSQDLEVNLINHVIVVDVFPTEEENNAWYGEAFDTDSYAQTGYYVPKVYEVSNLSSNAEATSMAEAILAQIQRDRSAGLVTVPHHCGQELLDRVTVVDARTGETFTDYVFSLRHIYEKGGYRGQARYDLEIGLGAAGRGITTIPVHDYGSSATEDEPQLITKSQAQELYDAMGPLIFNMGWAGGKAPFKVAQKEDWSNLMAKMGPMIFNQVTPQMETPSTSQPDWADIMAKMGPVIFNQAFAGGHTPYGQSYSPNLRSLMNRKPLYAHAANPLLARMRGLAKSLPGDHGYVPAGSGGAASSPATWKFLSGGDASQEFDILYLLMNGRMDGGTMTAEAQPAMNWLDTGNEDIVASGGTA